MSPESGYYQRDRSWDPAALTPQYKTSVLRSPQYPLLSLDNKISEMTGPRFGHSKTRPSCESRGGTPQSPPLLRRRRCSTTLTRRPTAARQQAQTRPLCPAPMITTS